MADEGVDGGQRPGAAGQHQRRPTRGVAPVRVRLFVEEIGGGFVGAALTGVVQRRLPFPVFGVDFELFVFVDEKSDDVAEPLGRGVVQRRGAVPVRDTGVGFEFE